MTSTAILATTPVMSPRDETKFLNTVVGELEVFERQIRALQTLQLGLMAEAVDRLVVSRRETRSSASRELAHRALRAEISTALRLSEHVVDLKLSVAVSMIRDFPAAGYALEIGEISLDHLRVIVDAGAVIGLGDGTIIRDRRRQYTEAVLEYARRETPNRLRPIARRLAEEFAEASIDERHAESVKRRRVVVTDADDGMADLLAHLPALRRTQSSIA